MRGAVELGWWVGAEAAWTCSTVLWASAKLDASERRDARLLAGRRIMWRAAFGQKAVTVCGCGKLHAPGYSALFLLILKRTSDTF